MKTLVIIPARIGSVSIKKKNLQKVGKFSLLIRAAKKIQTSKHKLDLFISTESKEIISSCDRFKLNYIRRPQKLAKNKTSTDDVLIHALKTLSKNKKNYDILSLVQCTSPFFDIKDFDKGIQLILNKKADTVFTASKFHGFLWKLNNLNFAIPINHNKNKRLRRQDMGTEYREDGAITITKVNLFLKYKSRFPGKIKIIETPQINNLDINGTNDLKIAKIFQKYLFKKN